MAILERADSIAGRREPATIETDPSTTFTCEYPPGINRVLSLPPYLLIDNIARNVEIWHLDTSHRVVSRARYDRTSYPGDPDASLLDLDIHAAFVRDAGRELVTVNHFGRVRRFSLPTPAGQISPTGERQLLGDMERVLLVGDAFIGSSPRGEYTADEAQPGLFLFEPLRAWADAGSGTPDRLAWQQTLVDWGVISALAVTSDEARLAVAAGPRLGVFRLHAGPSGGQLGECVAESALPFECQWLQFDDDDRIWAAGHHSPEAGGADWDACRGGQLVVLTPFANTRELVVELPDVTAWGYGADPIIVASGRGAFVLGRDGSLHTVDPPLGATRPLYAPVAEADEGAAPSLGIGHATLCDRSIYAGFSRGGFRLLRYDLVPAQRPRTPRALARLQATRHAVDTR
jgi:hypothetical protein